MRFSLNSGATFLLRLQFWTRAGFVVGVLLLPSFGHASQFSRCAVYLFAARDAHWIDVPGRTEFAVSELARFRREKLSRYDYALSNSPIFGSDLSSAQVQQAVTRRLNSLLAGPNAIENGEQERIFGSVFRGDEIRQELDFRRQTRQAADSLWSPVALFPASIVRAGTVAGIGALTLWSVAQGSALNTLLMLGVNISLRNLYEESLRSAQFWTFNFGDDAALRKLLPNLTEGRWYYRSFDLPVPLSLVRELWRRTDLQEHDFLQFHSAYTAARSTVKWTGNHLLPLHHDIKTEMGRMRVDELLSYDVPTKAAKLMTIVRLTQNARAALEPALLPAPQPN